MVLSFRATWNGVYGDFWQTMLTHQSNGFKEFGVWNEIKPYEE